MTYIGPPPTLTTSERDALSANDRPRGTVIYNSTVAQFQVNAGTGVAPSWRTQAPYIVAGLVDSTGTRLAGTGFSSAYNSGPVTYTLTFSPAFAFAPYVGGAGTHSGAAAASFTLNALPTTTTCVVKITDADGNNRGSGGFDGFTFIAIAI